MSDNPASDDSEESVESVIAETMDDPNIDAWTFACVDANGFTSTYGESGGSEDSYRTICAAVLMQFASASKAPQKEFIRDVINEYNDRKKVSQGGTSMPETGGGE